MGRHVDAATELRDVLTHLFGTELPLRIRAWDGSESGPPGGPALVLRRRRALRRLLWAPNEVGLGRAFVSGDLTVDGDLYEALHSAKELLDAAGGRTITQRINRGEMLRLAWRLRLLGPPPAPPAEEIRRLSGRQHSKNRDATAISHHYDVGNDFYRHVLGESMVYSCAYWTHPDDPDYGLADAQRDKCELICRKLQLRAGQRLLDVGCGWGSLVIHAAKEYGVRAVGVTLSVEQAEFARKRVAEEGLEELVEIRVQDYRDVTDGTFDAIASVGMAEHVGTRTYRQYAETLFGLLVPEGRLLNHQITRRPEREDPNAPSFIQSYVFPDGELQTVGTVVNLLERANFEVRDVESLREHYARTLRAWVSNVEEHWAECVQLTSPGRARVWRLYMAACALAFEANRVSVHQVLAVKPSAAGESGMPVTRAAWLR